MLSNTVHTVLSSITPCPTTMLADFYQVEPSEILKKFHDNRERFVEGKHYTALVGKDNYLWTQRGALHYAMLLDSDRSWEVWKMLAKVGADSVFADLFGVSRNHQHTKDATMITNISDYKTDENYPLNIEECFAEPTDMENRAFAIDYCVSDFFCTHDDKGVAWILAKPVFGSTLGELVDEKTAKIGYYAYSECFLYCHALEIDPKDFKWAATLWYLLEAIEEETEKGSSITDVERKAYYRRLSKHLSTSPENATSRT